MKFNKDTKIGEILEVAPEKADILIEIGMHCLGCPASNGNTRRSLWSTWNRCWRSYKKIKWRKIVFCYILAKFDEFEKNLKNF